MIFSNAILFMLLIGFICCQLKAHTHTHTHTPKVILAAAKMVEGQCDAIDINFGCPQKAAKRGNYGAFLLDDFEKMVSPRNPNPNPKPFPNPKP